MPMRDVTGVPDTNPPSTVRIPGSDLDVSRICLGTTQIGSGTALDDSFLLLDAFVEMGGNFIDTASVYSDWLPDIERSASEKTIGRWLVSHKPGNVVVATKGGHPPLAEPRRSRLDETSVRSDLARSLDHLGTESIDLYYLHRDDPGRPVEDMVGYLNDLCDEGLIRHYGLSNWPVNRLDQAVAAARRHGWRTPVASQPQWSLAEPNPECLPDDLAFVDEATIRWHRQTGIAIVPYSSQAKGYFDKLAAGTVPSTGLAGYDSLRNREVGQTLTELGRQIGATPTQTMLALMVHAPLPVVPIVGSRSVEQLRNSFAAAGLRLPDNETRRRLEQALLAPSSWRAATA